MQEIFFQQFDTKKREKVDLVILWPIITYIEDLKIFRYMGNFLVIGYSRASIAGLSIDRSVNKIKCTGKNNIEVIKPGHAADIQV